MSKRLNIIIEKDEFGYYAYCPDLEGCQTQGDTLDEVTENIKEAIELYLETLSDKDKISLTAREILTTSYEVSIV
ncbi:MAG: type II toxin-antitoxin system HicB family antitoxin [Ignavibacteriaceae bacterium]|mgnify:FL=1|nr:type II toxin-antitoxin system HicB family antitoxin [Ignavibacterium sp.]MCC6255526.1 type II toxin-antitoxin system HicB family antitoxin [Ignavibacteriaceae bacterium]HMN23374.1 type II toxin-antitoxin system HicB family antitoxin [Ignavibacteriaceae bacterium]HRN26056.1 type II toxin-antitoxin system HicB family antitoxin [Ignavibacteriaceae bacterium]HRP92602.1 type II toxin-antitoxin system HicB family antitoxin [Ignavibacteriaceae bacterium]